MQQKLQGRALERRELLTEGTTEVVQGFLTSLSPKAEPMYTGRDGMRITKE